MSWRDGLIQAAFRGIPFYVHSASMEGGRRTVLHQYPFRDLPYTEDIGSDADTFKIQGYVIANANNDYKYFAMRDNLIEALKGEGPGTLRHPWLGEMQVLTGKFTMDEAFVDGGVARFTMNFVQSGESRYPGDATDVVGLVDSEADGANNVLLDSFGKNINVNTPGGSLARSVANLQSGYNQMRSALFAVRGGLNALLKYASTYIDSSALGTTVIAMDSACTVAGLVLSSFDSFKALGGMTGNYTNNLITGLCSGRIVQGDVGYTTTHVSSVGSIDRKFGLSIIQNLLTMASFTGVSETISTGTLSGAQESANKQVILNINIGFSLTTMCQIATRIAYNGKEDLDTIVEEICAAINAQLLNLGALAADDTYKSFGISMDDPDSYSSLENLRNMFVKSMTELRKTLKDVDTYYAPPDPMTTLTLAYERYSDVGMETDIIDRNFPNIKNPGFLPGGIALELKGE